jgi:hypothetical protein
MVTTSAMDSAPGQLVTVVLVGADEDHRTRFGGNAGAQLVAFVQIAGNAQVQDVDELVDGAGGSRAAEDHHIPLGVAPHRLQDDLPGVLAKTRGLQPGAAGLGVGVGVKGQHLFPDEILDEAQGAPTGRVVGVGHAPGSVGPVQGALVTDDGIADLLDQVLHVLLHDGPLAAGRTGGPAAPGIIYP